MPRHTKHSRKKNHQPKQKTPVTPIAITKEATPDAAQGYLSYLSVPKGLLATSFNLLLAASKLVPAASYDDGCESYGKNIFGTFSGTCYRIYEIAHRVDDPDPDKGYWCQFDDGTHEIFDAIIAKSPSVCGELTGGVYCDENYKNIFQNHSIGFARGYGEVIQKQFEDCINKLRTDETAAYEASIWWAEYKTPIICLPIAVIGICGLGALSLYAARNRIKSCFSEQGQVESATDGEAMQIIKGVNAELASQNEVMQIVIDPNVEVVSQSEYLNEESPLFKL